jgi:hypothetical protein
MVGCILQPYSMNGSGAQEQWVADDFGFRRSVAKSSTDELGETKCKLLEVHEIT